jgi:hypothetical protein
MRCLLRDSLHYPADGRMLKRRPSVVEPFAMSYRVEQRVNVAKNEPHKVQSITAICFQSPSEMGYHTTPQSIDTGRCICRLLLALSAHKRRSQNLLFLFKQVVYMQIENTSVNLNPAPL